MYYVVQIVFLKLVVQYVIKLLSSIFDFFVCFFMSTWRRGSLGGGTSPCAEMRHLPHISLPQIK